MGFMDRQNKIVITALVITCCAAVTFYTLYLTKNSTNEKEYQFTITSKKGTFDEVRNECIMLHGDLITINLGPKGQRYHERILSLVRSRRQSLWVGITDRDREYNWKFITDNTDFDGNNKLNLFQWAKGEPNNKGNQDCAKVSFGFLPD